MIKSSAGTAETDSPVSSAKEKYFHWNEIKVRKKTTLPRKELVQREIERDEYLIKVFRANMCLVRPFMGWGKGGGWGGGGTVKDVKRWWDVGVIKNLYLTDNFKGDG